MGVALDTSAVVAFLDADDELHPLADEVVRRYRHERLEISVIAYSELLVGVGTGHHEREILDKFIDGLRVAVLPLDAMTAELAASLGSESPSLRLPDALILAAASRSEATTLVTGDRRLASINAPDVDTLVLA